ncbi:hypothetical protein ACHAXR_006073 [Thalassiosira sp. AJA248-18]
MQKKEGGMINKSLLALSKVLVLMSLGQKNSGHINYRDSKLTRILKTSLSGNARMAVICCISPSDKYVEETRSTLQFATRAKLVKTSAVANEVIDDSDLIEKLRLENARAKWEICKVENRLREMTNIHSSALSTKRELNNLKKFVFSGRSTAVSLVRNISNRVSVGSVFCSDEHCNLGRGNEFAFPQPDNVANPKASKDDLHVRPSCDEVKDGGIFFRAALDFKARHAKHLEARLKEATKDKRDANVKVRELEAEIDKVASERDNLLNTAQSRDDVSITCESPSEDDLSAINSSLDDDDFDFKDGNDDNDDEAWGLALEQEESSTFSVDRDQGAIYAIALAIAMHADI